MLIREEARSDEVEVAHVAMCMCCMYQQLLNADNQG